MEGETGSSSLVLPHRHRPKELIATAKTTIGYWWVYLCRCGKVLTIGNRDTW